jgi:hypothetical protein
MDTSQGPGSKHEILVGDLERLPLGPLAELCQFEAWVLWQVRERRGKITKPPLQADGRLAKSDDPSTWCTFQEALAAYAAEGAEFSGIGVVLPPGYAAFDLDDCRDPETGRIVPQVEEMLDRLGSYAEVTPSGTGLRVIGRCDPSLPEIHRKLQLPGTSGASVEIYRHARRYITVTGLHVEGTADALADVGDKADLILAELDQGTGNSNVVQFPSEKRRGPGRPRKEEREAKVLEEVIREGQYEKFEGDRSRAVFYVVNECVRKGWKDEEITAALTDPGNKISEHVQDQPRPEEYVKKQIRKARDNNPVTITDFVAFMPDHDYIYAPDGQHWPAASVNARVGSIQTPSGPVPASSWLDRNQAVEGITWSPGDPQVIEDRIITDGGWREHRGARTWNLYHPPQIRLRPGDVSGWLDHLRFLYPDGADRILRYFAHRVQRPQEKPNFSLLLGGAPGIGKDTVIKPLLTAVGLSNVKDAKPSDILGPWSHFAKCVVLRINEMSDLGDFDRYKLYERLKIYQAAPPDMVEVNEKFRRQYYVPNVLGIVMTTNHLSSGLYLPAEDRRHEVYWSERIAADVDADAMKPLHDWMDSEVGIATTAHFLANLDLSGYSVKVPPPKTEAFWQMVHSHSAPENAELGDILERLSHPVAVTLDMIKEQADEDLRGWLGERKNARSVGHRIEECGYRRFVNPDAKDGSWKIKGKKRSVYSRSDATRADVYAMIEALNGAREMF